MLGGVFRGVVDSGFSVRVFVLFYGLKVCRVQRLGYPKG